MQFNIHLQWWPEGHLGCTASSPSLNFYHKTKLGISLLSLALLFGWLAGPQGVEDFLTCTQSHVYGLEPSNLPRKYASKMSDMLALFNTLCSAFGKPLLSQIFVSLHNKWHNSCMHSVQFHIKHRWNQRFVELNLNVFVAHTYYINYFPHRRAVQSFFSILQFNDKNHKNCGKVRQIVPYIVPLVSWNFLNFGSFHCLPEDTTHRVCTPCFQGTNSVSQS